MFNVDMMCGSQLSIFNSQFFHFPRLDVACHHDALFVYQYHIRNMVDRQLLQIVGIVPGTPDWADALCYAAPYLIYILYIRLTKNHS